MDRPEKLPLAIATALPARHFAVRFWLGRDCFAGQTGQFAAVRPFASHPQINGRLAKKAKNSTIPHYPPAKDACPYGTAHHTAAGVAALPALRPIKPTAIFEKAAQLAKISGYVNRF